MLLVVCAWPKHWLLHWYWQLSTTNSSSCALTALAPFPQVPHGLWLRDNLVLLQVRDPDLFFYCQLLLALESVVAQLCSLAVL